MVRLLLQDLPNQVAAARADVAAHLLATPVCVDGQGAAQSVRVGSWRAAQRSGRGGGGGDNAREGQRCGVWRAITVSAVRQARPRAWPGARQPGDTCAKHTGPTAWKKAAVARSHAMPSLPFVIRLVPYQKQGR